MLLAGRTLQRRTQEPLVVTRIAYDEFADVDATSLDVHVMNAGDGWTEAAQDWSIASNKAIYVGGVDGEAVAVVDVGEADVTVTHVFSINAGAIPDAGIIGRYTDVDNFWFIGLNQNGDWLKIYVKSFGSFAERASASLTINPATDYELEVRFAADAIIAKVDGIEVARYESATFNQAATSFGMRGNVQAAAAISSHDTFTVTIP